ncbi:MAG TPA: Crp/Fnr family transcriptional regulator [Microvirga sp.]|jgi:CRP-like cAMP-binding protein|nr:Crp/Fnr family transcriptional regulator [Microvirga sp.]
MLVSSSRGSGRAHPWFDGTVRAGLHPAPRPAASAQPHNHLLRALPEAVLEALHPHLERVALKRRQVLHERNVPLTHAYFIERGAASLLSRAGDGGTLECGMLGRFDLAGLPIVLGTGRTPHRCVVQVPGEALRIRAEDLAQAMSDHPALRAVLLHHVQAALIESAQLAVCNSSHTLRQRLARWLLGAQDRLGGHEIPLTHQCASRALAVRRAGVTTALGEMEDAGLLRRGRGKLVVADRAGLEAQACDCDRAIRAEHRRIACDAVDGATARRPPAAWTAGVPVAA